MRSQLDPPKGASLAAETRGEPTLGVAAFLITLSVIAPLSIDTFLPSMPEIADGFESSEGFVTLGVTLFLVSLAGSQLFYGYASDRWGRRPLLFAGLGLYTLGGVFCLGAPSAEVLILGRVMQGLGGGAGPSLANAMTLDLFTREGATKMIGYQSIIFPIAPAVAPIIGGVIAAAVGWRAVFVLMTALGVLMAAWYGLTLGETRPEHVGPRRSLRSGYRTLFTSGTFVGFAAVLGLLFAGQLLFVATSSFVLIDRLGMSSTGFGFAFGFMALGLMAGATVANRLVGRVPAHMLALAGSAWASTAAAVLLLLVLGGAEHAVVVIVAAFLTASGIGVTRPSAMAGALVPFPEIAGLASSMLIFTQLTISSGYNVIFSLVFAPGVVTLAAGMFGPIVLGLCVATLVVVRTNRAHAVVVGPQN